MWRPVTLGPCLGSMSGNLCLVVRRGLCVAAVSVQVIMEGGRNVVPDVWEVLDKIKEFSDKVSGQDWLPSTLALMLCSN